MTTIDKESIATELVKFCNKMGSQNKAATALQISSAVVSRILKGNWNLIADEMWLKIAAGCGYSAANWNIVETRDLQTLTLLMQDAQHNGSALAVTGRAGSGKTMALKQYCKDNKTAYLLCCNEYWNRKMFMQELLTVMGHDYSGYTVGEMMEAIINRLKMTKQPLLILDEADKLNDNVMYFFITLYNKLEDSVGNLRCGLVMVATNFLEKRIMRGLRLNKKGYQEIYSRICRKFIPLHGVTTSDITMVCQANGIDTPAEIREVIEDSENDLRRVRRKIHSLIMLKEVA